MFELRDDLVAVRDPRAGWLDPEQCNTAHLEVAEKSGAHLRFDDGIASWSADGEGVSVKTMRGDNIGADHLVLCVGARTRDFLNDVDLPLEIERQSVFWFDMPAGPALEPGSFPIYAYEYVPGEICYGFPRLARGVKASVMHAGEIVARADEVRRVVDESEAGALRAALSPVLPRVARAQIRETGTCLFTNAPGHDFIIDFHPAHRQVVVSSACSGHGFKFSSVIGEIQADLVTEGKSAFDLTPFRMDRFT
jgi:glycine/D-amino acid oxidase-like deaminating enzyme